MTASIAFADVPVTFQSGELLTAVQLNTNFAALDLRLAALESAALTQTSGGEYTSGAGYCGATDPTVGDLSDLPATGVGYARAKAACEDTCASPGAHMCEGSELTRAAQLGTTFTAPGWYAAGSYASFGGEGSYECFGWTSSDASTLGPLWNLTTSPFPSAHNCDNSYPVLCCE